MMIIQPRCCYRGDKKLTAVGVLPGIRHTNEQWPIMFHLEGFIVEIFAVNTEKASTVAILDVTTCGIARVR